MHVTARHGDNSFDGIGSKADCTAGMHILHENIYFVAQQQQQLHTWMDYTAFINEKWDIARSMSLCPDRWIYESTPSPMASFELNKTLIKMQNRLHCIHNKIIEYSHTPSTVMTGCTAAEEPSMYRSIYINTKVFFSQSNLFQINIYIVRAHKRLRCMTNTTSNSDSKHCKHYPTLPISNSYMLW
jgi:hypothetical protein